MRLFWELGGASTRREGDQEADRSDRDAEVDLICYSCCCCRPPIRRFCSTINMVEKRNGSPEKSGILHLSGMRSTDNQPHRVPRTVAMMGWAIFGSSSKNESMHWMLAGACEFVNNVLVDGRTMMFIACRFCHRSSASGGFGPPSE